jgi:hypothetical protein
VYCEVQAFSRKVPQDGHENAAAVGVGPTSSGPDWDRGQLSTSDAVSHMSVGGAGYQGVDYDVLARIFLQAIVLYFKTDSLPTEMEQDRDVQPLASASEVITRRPGWEQVVAKRNDSCPW